MPLPALHEIYSNHELTTEPGGFWRNNNIIVVDNHGDHPYKSNHIAARYRWRWDNHCIPADSSADDVVGITIEGVNTVYGPGCNGTRYCPLKQVKC